MHRVVIPIATLVIFAGYAFAQTQTDTNVSRTFNFKNISGQQQMDEMVMTIRQVAGTPPYSFDVATAMLTVRGTPEQVALAAWLVDQLDVPAGKPGVHEYTATSTDATVARVFYLTSLTSPQSIQELITTLRQVGDVHQIFALQEKGALALRGTPEQVGLVSWLIDRLDVPAGDSGFREYSGPSADGTVARVFYLANTTSPLSIQELITTLRMVAEINKLFSIQGKSAIALRAKPAEAAIAEWLIHNLDQPPLEAGPSVHTFAVPGTTDDQIHIFYEPKTFTPQLAHQALLDARTKAGTSKIFNCTTAHALIARGTSEQLTKVQRSITDQIKPN